MTAPANRPQCQSTDDPRARVISFELGQKEFPANVGRLYWGGVNQANGKVYCTLANSNSNGNVNATGSNQHPGATTTITDIADPTKYTNQWPVKAGYGWGKRPRCATIMIIKNGGGKNRYPIERVN